MLDETRHYVGPDSKTWLLESISVLCNTVVKETWKTGDAQTFVKCRNTWLGLSLPVLIAS
jgi:hypothetical protein